MTAPARSPALFRCSPCGHVWPALWTPMESSLAIRAMKACCPACGERRKLFMATKQEAAIWAAGPRGEPCFVESGGVPVPYTVSWSAEETFHLARCPHAGGRAICQAAQPGEGKPQFGKPHSQRQRQTIARGLCDLCGRPLALRTKASLSHARPRGLGARGVAILQVEPLLHKACAAESLRHCPSLKRDIAAGTLYVRQVTRWRVQMAVMSAVYVEEITGEAVKAIGHAKVELLAWVERDADWLAAP